ncbi:MAG: hypothetical protein ACOCYU_06040 [Brevefilum sp.]
MDIGMLWFDNDPQSDVASKVQKAAAYYRKKYGENPNLCFVHPSMIPKTKAESGAISICSNTTMLPNHFWIGVQSHPMRQP